MPLKGYDRPSGGGCPPQCDRPRSLGARHGPALCQPGACQPVEVCAPEDRRRGRGWSVPAAPRRVSRHPFPGLGAVQPLVELRVKLVPQLVLGTPSRAPVRQERRGVRIGTGVPEQPERHPRRRGDEHCQVLQATSAGWPRRARFAALVPGQEQVASGGDPIHGDRARAGHVYVVLFHQAAAAEPRQEFGEGESQRCFDFLSPRPTSYSAPGVAASAGVQGPEVVESGGRGLAEMIGSNHSVQARFCPEVQIPVPAVG